LLSSYFCTRHLLLICFVLYQELGNLGRAADGCCWQRDGCGRILWSAKDIGGGNRGRCSRSGRRGPEVGLEEETGPFTWDTHVNAFWFVWYLMTGSKPRTKLFLYSYILRIGDCHFSCFFSHATSFEVRQKHKS
jgi:hypothetical protein